MRREELLVLTLALAFCFFVAVPFSGAFASRAAWRRFRRRFYGLRNAPELDYAVLNGAPMRSAGAGAGADAEPCDYRISGTLESLTDGGTMWLASEGLTLPVDLSTADLYFIPQTGENDDDKISIDIPTRLKKAQVPALGAGCRVFAGGLFGTVDEDGRRAFIADKKKRFVVIFFEGDEKTLTARISSAGRHKSEYWNAVTPYAITAGLFAMLFIALANLSRPAYRINVIAAFAASSGPLFPLFPPGVFLTMLYYIFWRNSRISMSRRDLTLLEVMDDSTTRADIRRRASRFAHRAWLFESIAWIFLAGAVGINILFVAVIIFRIL